MAKKLNYRKAVPWIHRSNPLVTSWVWETPHFTATIFSEGLTEKKMFNWKVSDKSSGSPVPFDSSTAKDFNEATQTLLEVIGKSYDRVLGYQEYAGDLATSFKVYDGRNIDLGVLIGDTVTISVLNVENEYDDLLLTGQLDISHYEVTLKTDDELIVSINPAYIKGIKREFSPTEVLDELAITASASSRGKRIFYDEWRPGCTGKAGFNQGTTEHKPNDPFCPVHNI